MQKSKAKYIPKYDERYQGLKRKAQCGKRKAESSKLKAVYSK